jgi:hypothetical protein
MSIDYTPETEDEVVLKEKLRIFAQGVKENSIVLSSLPPDCVHAFLPFRGRSSVLPDTLTDP